MLQAKRVNVDVETQVENQVEVQSEQKEAGVAIVPAGNETAVATPVKKKRIGVWERALAHGVGGAGAVAQRMAEDFGIRGSRRIEEITAQGMELVVRKTGEVVTDRGELIAQIRFGEPFFQHFDQHYNKFVRAAYSPGKKKFLDGELDEATLEKWRQHILEHNDFVEPHRVAEYTPTDFQWRYEAYLIVPNLNGVQRELIWNMPSMTALNYKDYALKLSNVTGLTPDQVLTRIVLKTTKDKTRTYVRGEFEAFTADEEMKPLGVKTTGLL